MQYKLHEWGCDASYLWWLCPGAKHYLPKSLPLFSAIVMTLFKYIVWPKILVSVFDAVSRKEDWSFAVCLPMVM